MELVTFESKAYKELVEKIDKIAQYVVKKESETQDSTEKGSIEEDWLDNDQAADILGISTRTLQRLRAKNLISYSRLGGKCHYLISDIETALRNRVIRCTPGTIEDFRKNYLLSVKRK